MRYILLIILLCSTIHSKEYCIIKSECAAYSNKNLKDTVLSLKINDKFSVMKKTKKYIFVQLRSKLYGWVKLNNVVIMQSKFMLFDDIGVDGFNDNHTFIIMDKTDDTSLSVILNRSFNNDLKENKEDHKKKYGD